VLKHLFSVRLPLFAKIFISSVALVVLLSVAVSVTMNSVTQSLLSDEIMKYHTSYLEKIDSNLTYTTQKVAHLIDNTAFAEDIARIDSLPSYTKYELREEITAQLNDIIIYSNILGVTLIVEDNMFMSGQYYSTDDFTDKSNWPEASSLYYRSNEQYNSYITFTKRVKINADTDGLVIVTISPILKEQETNGIGVFALNEASNVVWCKNADQEAITTYLERNPDNSTARLKDNRYITVNSGMDGIKLVMCINDNFLEKRGEEILNYLVTMTLAIIVLCVIFSWILSRTITTRVNVLKEKMQHFKLNARIEEGDTGISLKKKIMLYYIAVCFVPIAAMSCAYYNISMGIMEEEVARVFEQSVGHIGDNILMATDGFAIDGKYIANDEYIQETLASGTPMDKGKAEAVARVAMKDVGCENFVIYDKDGNCVYALKNGEYAPLSNRPGKTIWIAPSYDEFNQRTAGFVMPIKGNEYREPQYMQTIGYLRIDFKESVLADIMALSENSSANIYMLDADGEIIMSNNAENGAIMPEVESKEIVCEYIVNDEWKICGVVQTDMLFTNRRMILLYLFLILLTVTMLIMIFSNQISRIIITPMKILNDNIRDNMQNRAESRLSLKTGDEIEELCKSFNKMNDEIDRLVNEVYEAEIARKELEVKHKEAHLNALQAQINPHFLYNTFETTNWLILQNQNEEAVNMINRLSDIFRLGINRGRNTFTLREELKQATSYIDIQKMRYAHKLSVVWEYDDSLLECRVVKTILQPILENAIYHGIEPKEEGGEIEISIDRNGDVLEICVIDTGVGIEEEKCRDINSDLKNNENKVLRSIGLKNVNDRIKLMYGDDYGISIESIYGKYTEVLITMPFIAKEGDEIDNV